MTELRWRIEMENYGNEKKKIGKKKRMFYVIVRYTSVDRPYMCAWINHYESLGFDVMFILSMDRTRMSYASRTIKIEWIFPNIEETNADIMLQKIGNGIFEKLYKEKKKGWILNVDNDEYLWLPAPLKIWFRENIDEHIGQLQFPWIMVEHDGELPENPYVLIKERSWYRNEHVKSMGRIEWEMLKMETPHRFGDRGMTWMNGLCRQKSQCMYTSFIHTEWQFPVIFHLHTQGYKSVYLKICHYELSEKCDVNERRKLREAVEEKSEKKLYDLKKWRLKRCHCEKEKMEEKTNVHWFFQKRPECGYDRKEEEKLYNEIFRKEEKEWLYKIHVE